MKRLLSLIVLLFSFAVYSQTAVQVGNSVNTPTSVPNPTVLLGCNPVPSGVFKVYVKDDIRWETYNINGLLLYIYNNGDLRYPRSNGTNLEYIKGDGSKATFPTNLSAFTNGPGYITSYTETDPIWSAVAAAYRTKVQNDLLYQPIGSYVTTESDPTVPVYSKSLTGFPVIKTDTDLLYEPLFSKNTAFNKNFGTTSNTVAEGNDSRINNGQTAFSWGNHGLAGYLLSSTAASTYQPIGTYLTPSSTNTLTNKSGNISQWTNDSGYLTSFSETDPTVPSYSKSLTAFSVIKTSTDALYSPLSHTHAFVDITSKPTTIAGYGITDFNSLGDARWSLLGHTHTFASLTSKPTTLSGYGITDAYPLVGNPSGFLTSVPAQSFASLTGKPTTLSGYGITDAYPLTGNPSGFLTTEVDGSVTNEIELPTQTGQSGKILSTNGTTPSWITANTGTVTNVSSVDANATITSPTTTPVITVVSAPKLQTARSIQGVAFDGTGNINPINGTGFVKTTGTTLSYDNSTYLTGNQTITLSGDVTGSGATSITTTLANAGTAGTYGIVTTDSKGRVISGKKTEAYSGTTIAAGTYTVTFGTAYSVAPNIQANIINGTDTQNIRTTSITTTGFTVLVRNRVDVVGLLPSWNNVSGASVDVLITEK